MQREAFDMQSVHASLITSPMPMHHAVLTTPGRPDATSVLP
jgi:hypothetical protein